jgi:hypothetical protein
MKNFFSYPEYLQESQKGTLYSDDNPKDTVKGMRYATGKEAEESIDRLESLYKDKKITHARASSIATAMHNRAKFHANPNPGIKAAERVWKTYQTKLKRRTQELKEKSSVLGFDEFISEKKGPCWSGYRQLGTKNKGGKMVPNCVPIDKK